MHSRTQDGYEFVRARDGWYYYAELDACGDFASSGFSVGLDDPEENGIPKGLEWPPERRAQLQAAGEASRTGEPYELEECPIGGAVSTVIGSRSWGQLKMTGGRGPLRQQTF